MESFNIIGDIAGQYETFLALIAKMPQQTTIVSVGDMVDRGPRSRDVVQWFRAGHRSIALMGNHEHMMVDWALEYRSYDRRDWASNGGLKTIESYLAYEGIPKPAENHYVERDLIREVLKKDARWMEALPLYLFKPGLVVSHAPLRKGEPKWGDMDFDEVTNLVWNRADCEYREGVVQIHGHNSHRGLQIHKKDDKIWGLNIDTSRENVLTGVHWPTLQLFHQEYLK